MLDGVMPNLDDFCDMVLWPLLPLDRPFSSMHRVLKWDGLARLNVHSSIVCIHSQLNSCINSTCTHHQVYLHCLPLQAYPVRDLLCTALVLTGLNWYMCSAALLTRVTVTWCTRHMSAPSEGRRADRGDRYRWLPHGRTEHH